MVLVFNFFLFRVVDRDPLARYRGRSKLSQEQRAAIIERFGLDGSKWDQFVQLHQSTRCAVTSVAASTTTRPVKHRDPRRLPNTLLLVGISTVLTIGIGLWIGIRAGWQRGGRFDKISDAGDDGPVRHTGVLPRDDLPRASSAPGSAGSRPVGSAIRRPSYSGFAAVRRSCSAPRAARGDADTRLSRLVLAGHAHVDARHASRGLPHHGSGERARATAT